MQQESKKGTAGTQFSVLAGAVQYLRVIYINKFYIYIYIYNIAKNNIYIINIKIVNVLVYSRLKSLTLTLMFLTFGNFRLQRETHLDWIISQLNHAMSEAL